MHCHTYEINDCRTTKKSLACVVCKFLIGTEVLTGYFSSILLLETYSM